MEQLVAHWVAGAKNLAALATSELGTAALGGVVGGLLLGALIGLGRRRGLYNRVNNQARLQLEDMRTANAREQRSLQQSATDYRDRLDVVQHELREQSVELSQALANNARLEEGLKQLAPTQARLDEVSTKLSRAEAECLRLTERASQAQSQFQSMSEAQSKLSSEFQVLADKIFKDQQQQFGDTHRAEVALLMDPLRSQLDQFRQAVDQNREHEVREQTVLKYELAQLKSLNQQLSDDAKSLTQALRGSAKLQGNWGELVLERVLENSGLVEGREFKREVSLQNRDGEQFRPDVLVLLPDERFVVVDAKVSLRAYEQALQAETEAGRKAQMSLHCQALRAHVTTLAGKQYERLEEIRSLDFVLLFVPIEGAFHAALQHAPELYSEAFKKNVVLVSPTTLLVTLRTIHNIWRYQQHSDNAEEIALRAGELIDRFVGFVDEIDVIDKNLDRARNATDAARRKLSTGRGSLVARAKTIQGLGVTSRRELPRVEVLGDEHVDDADG